MATRDFAAKKTVRLTTRGRKSGAPRTVTIWFVANGERSILVQHATGAQANWYQNLLKEPSVSLDFGTGPLNGRAVPIKEPARVQEVLGMVRRKYWSAWLIRLIARGATPVAAEISW